MTELKGQDYFLNLAEDLIGKCDDAGCEVLFSRDSSGLTRLANSTIHQNVHTDSTTIHIRVSRGDNVGVSSTNVINQNGLFDCLMNALEIMKTSEPLQGFPEPAHKAEYQKTETFLQGTADWGPMERAGVAKAAIDRGKEDGLTLAGAVETSVVEVAVATSNGVRAYQPLTGFSCNFIAMDGDGDNAPSGYCALTGRDASTADFKAIYSRACEKAVAARNPVDVEIGNYDVVLEGHAFAELLEWFNYIALNGKSVQEGRSPLAGHFDQKITGDKVTFIDDAFSGTCPGLPFDFDGTPRKRLPLIDHGIAKGVTWSRYLAKEEGLEPTGHGFGPSSTASDALALNIQMTPGEYSLDELVGKMDRGIQVTRFHYVNGLLDTRKAKMTGMTRDGAWLIENGQVKHAIKNMRFTDDMLDAWSRIDGVENYAHPCPAWWSAIGCYEVPGVLIRDFAFTGKTGKGS